MDSFSGKHSLHTLLFGANGFTFLTISHLIFNLTKETRILCLIFPYSSVLGGIVGIVVGVLWLHCRFFIPII